MITERIDAITRVTETATVRPAPRSVKIELTGTCNYRCGFCALRTRDAQPTVDMPFPLFQRLAGEMRDAGVEELGLFYLGEPFARPALLVDAIRYAKAIGFPYVFVTTNGSLATPERVAACMAAGLDSMKFSINAATGAQFEEIMGVRAALFDRALDHLAAARRVRDAHAYPCRIYASSIRFDGEQQDAMEALLADRVLPYVDEHYWLPLYSMGAFATERERELGYRPTAGNQGRLGALRPPLPCWAVFTEGHITHDGKLSACCFDASGTWAMADLTQVPFMAGWNSRPFVALREAHGQRDVRGTVCEGCVAYA